MDNSSHSDKTADEQTSIKEKISKYVFSNLLSVLWTISLLTGGFIFWLYFAEIQYFPDLAFDESVLFLVVSAITGVFFLLFIAFLIMSPYFMRWGVFLDLNRSSTQNDEEKKPDHELSWYFLSIVLVFSDALLFLYLMKRLENQWIYFIVFLLILIVIIFGHCHFYFQWDCKKLCPQSIIHLFSMVRGWFINSIFKISNRKSKKDGDKVPNKDELPNWLMIIAGGLSIFMMLLISIVIILPIVEKIAQNDFEQIKLFLLLLLIIVLGNFLFAFHIEKPEETKLWMLFLIPILTVLLVLLMARSTIIPKFVMNKYKFGNFETHQLLVDKSGCKILNKMKLSPDKEKEICYLENIKILSRLGQTFYLEKEMESKQQLNFTIPSKHVLSWSIINPSDKNKTGKKPNSAKTSANVKKSL